VTDANLYNSALSTWRVIETYDTEVPEDILAALEKEADREKDCHIYRLMWDDLFWYCGEDGIVLSDDTLEVCEKWIEGHMREHGISHGECYWFRVKMS
jgi:hypothetical protein